MIFASIREQVFANEPPLFEVFIGEKKDRVLPSWRSAFGFLVQKGFRPIDRHFFYKL